MQYLLINGINMIVFRFYKNLPLHTITLSVTLPDFLSSVEKMSCTKYFYMNVAISKHGEQSSTVIVSVSFSWTYCSYNCICLQELVDGFLRAVPDIQQENISLVPLSPAMLKSASTSVSSPSRNSTKWVEQ